MSTRIRIVEPDEKWTAEFTAWLSAVYGAKEVAPRVLEIDDAGFDAECYHGIVPADAPVVSNQGLVPEAVRKYLETYQGNFEFLVSVKTQLAKKGTLSEKQIAAVERSIAREQAYNAPKAKLASPVKVAPPVERQFSVKSGEVLILSKSFSKKIAFQAGYSHPHYAFEVLSVEAETEKALLLTLKLTAKPTTHCCCCGALLTDPASVAAGIGPICAENYGGGSLQGVAHAVSVTAEVKTWIPKSVIKERAGLVQAA